MPAAILVPALATAIAGGTAAAASVYGAKKQSSSNKDAAASSERSTAAAIEEQKRQDADAKKQFEATQAFEQQKWNQQQQVLATQEARKDPYRTASRAALLHLNDLLGFDLGRGGVDPGVAAGEAAARTAPISSLMTPQSSTATATTPVIPPPSTRMVWLQSPNGQRQQVPESQVAHFVSKGAKVAA